MVTDLGYYQRILDTLSDRVEGLDTQAYKSVDSDRWQRAIHIAADSGATDNFRFWLDLGGSVAVTSSHIEMNGALLYVIRYQADTTMESRARIHASARALINLLHNSAVEEARVLVRGYDVQPQGDSADWLLISLQLTFIHNFEPER